MAIRKKEDTEEKQNKKSPANLILVLEKQPDEPVFRTKRILSQNDVMDWVNGRKLWKDFPEASEVDSNE